MHGWHVVTGAPTKIFTTYRVPGEVEGRVKGRDPSPALPAGDRGRADRKACIIRAWQTTARLEAAGLSRAPRPGQKTVRRPCSHLEAAGLPRDGSATGVHARAFSRPGGGG